MWKDVIDDRFSDKIKKDISEKSHNFAKKEREIVGKNIGRITKQQIEKFGIVNKSLRKFSGVLGISQDELKSAVEREGFEVRGGMIRRKE